MIIVAEESPHQHEDLLSKSVMFTRALYVEEYAHAYRLDHLSNHGRFFVVRHNDYAIGCGAYVWRNEHEIELKHVFVDGASRGLGCGRALLAHIEQTAMSDGVKKIVLETSKKQQEAINLYRAFGYVCRTPYHDPCHHEVVFMEKVL